MARAIVYLTAAGFSVISHYTDKVSPLQDISDTGDSCDSHAIPLHENEAPDAPDPDLTRVIDAWQDLPEHVRAAVLALVATSAGGK